MARKSKTAPVEAPLEETVVSDVVVSRRRKIGICCGIYLFLAFFALVSYDWQDIPLLCNPPPEGAPVNRLGAMGAWMTFYGYALLGLAYRYCALPILALLTAFLLHGRVRCFRLRVVWMTGLLISLACLFQACGGDDGHNLPLLAELNLRPNAGGAIGQWIVTDFLRPLIGSMGVPLLLYPLCLLFLSLIIGVRNCVLFLARVMTPRELKDELPKNTDARELLRRQLAPKGNDEAPADEAPAAPKRTLQGFFSALFRHREEADAQPSPDPRELLAARVEAQQEPGDQGWGSVPAAPEETGPLFEAAVETPPPEPVKAPKKAAPPPPPEATPFTLSSDAPGTLKPVSPLKSVTLPAVATNDNDAAEESAPTTDYTMPSTALLDAIPPRAKDADDVQLAVEAIESVFQQFGIAAQVVGQIRGPVLTLFEVQPAPGVKLERFQSYERNLLMALRAESIRIQAPIPGRDVVGIEVPNTVRQSVTLREVLEGDTWRQAERKMALPLALGKLATGGDLVVDLAAMPHLLVAGGTGSGKSVALNDMLVGLLMSRRPDQMRLIMIDPKRVEFTAYDDLPHLLNPVVVEPKKVIFALRWAVVEMNHRYKLLQRYGVRNIGDYNQRVEAPLPHRENPTQKLPYIVIVIDELADLMLEVKSDIEPPITSLTQKARAAGIHLIIATQRPTTNVITGTIKANIPGRIALRVTQSNDSRTIIDENGAENLIGKGDMLLYRAGKATQRSQAAWVSDGEINRICDFIKEQAGPAFDRVLSKTIDRIKEDKPEDDVNSILVDLVPEESPAGDEVALAPVEDKSDEGYYKQALEYIRQTGRFSTSALQRRLSIGYNKAGRITDMLEERGIIGRAGKAGGSREILVDLNAMAREALAGTDGEMAAPDTRTTPAEDTPPDFPPSDDGMPLPDEAPIDLGDFDPTALDTPEAPQS